ncbi:MAG: ImmA/IrrE family metallo-endopeptidase, partial [Lentisphaeria bacterium]
ESNVPYLTRIGRDKVMTKVAEKAVEVIDCYFKLEDVCNARKHSEIPLQVHFYNDDRGVEELANKVRSFLNIHDSIAFDYAELLENYGFRVINCGFMRDLQSFSYFDAANRNAFFFINGNNTPERQTFNLITELGLIFMWEQFMKSPDLVPDEDALRMAKKFAAFFLMPAPTVLRTVRQLGIKSNQWNWDILLRVKNHFGISAEAFLYRLHELELIDEKPFNLLKTKIKKYYEIHRHTEPGKSRREVVQNARIHDLISIAESKKTREANAINITLNRLKVFKA